MRKTCYLISTLLVAGFAFYSTGCNSSDESKAAASADGRIADLHPKTDRHPGQSLLQRFGLQAREMEERRAGLPGRRYALLPAAPGGRMIALHPVKLAEIGQSHCGPERVAQAAGDREAVIEGFPRQTVLPALEGDIAGPDQRHPEALLIAGGRGNGEAALETRR